MDVIAHLAPPLQHAEEMQADVGVLIDMLAHDPRIGAHYLDAQFLVQFAHEGRMRRLARLDLAAGEFPVSGVEGVGRALAEQESAVGPGDDRGGDVDDLFILEKTADRLQRRDRRGAENAA